MFPPCPNSPIRPSLHHSSSFPPPGRGVFLVQFPYYCISDHNKFRQVLKISRRLSPHCRMGSGISLVSSSHGKFLPFSASPSARKDCCSCKLGLHGLAVSSDLAGCTVHNVTVLLLKSCHDLEILKTDGVKQSPEAKRRVEEKKTYIQI